MSFLFGWDYDTWGNVSFSEENEAGRKDLQKSIMSYIAAFAKTGDPNKNTEDLTEWVKWSNNVGPKSIVFEADYEEAKISMMNEEYNRDEILAEVEALPEAVKSLVKILLW
ncbi:MAG: hypothetical protein BWY74_03354 [Firmicutes bacterium ADurb.Bin419]|nr:MAG: hypothetical protein BWY74_03354 [Firmicutes bacterium ADurb.Bin419]